VISVTRVTAFAAKRKVASVELRCEPFVLRACTKRQVLHPPAKRVERSTTFEVPRL